MRRLPAEHEDAIKPKLCGCMPGAGGDGVLQCPKTLLNLSNVLRRIIWTQRESHPRLVPACQSIGPCGARTRDLFHAMEAL